MSDVKQTMKDAVAAYKASDKPRARELLMKVVEQDEKNEKAWLLLSAVVDTLDDQQVALENVLAINPGNEKARKGLEVVNQKIADRDGTPVKPAAPPAATPDPSPPLADSGSAFPSGDSNLSNDPGWAAFLGESSADSSAPDTSDPFGASGSNAPWQTGSSPASASGTDSGGSSWDDFLSDSGSSFSTPDTPAAPAAPPSNSSVDWGGQDSSPEPTGRKVDQPSPDQYDDWISNLGLDNQPSSDPFSSNSTADSPADNTGAPGGDWSDLTSSADPFGGAGIGGDADSSDSDGWGDFGAVEDMFDNSDSSSDSPFGDSPTTAFDSPSGSNALGDGWDSFDMDNNNPFTADEPAGVSALGDGWNEVASSAGVESAPFAQGDDDILNSDPFAEDTDFVDPFSDDASQTDASRESGLADYQTFDEDDPFADEEASELFGAFEDFDFGNNEKPVGQKSTSGKTKARSSQNAKYFAKIPNDIPRMDKSSGLPVMTILLVVLNVAALAGIIVQLVM